MAMLSGIILRRSAAAAMRSILVTGVQGVGKSTVARIIGGLLGIGTLNYANLMLEADLTVGGRDEFVTWSWEKRMSLYQSVELILPNLFGPRSRDAEQLALLENHLSVRHGGELRTFPHGSIALYAPAAILVLESGSDEIAMRRRMDGSRLRSVESIDQIETQQSLNWDEAESIAARYRLPLTRIENQLAEVTARVAASWVSRNCITE